jgi:malonyl-CoA O-methyltransferase
MTSNIIKSFSDKAYSYDSQSFVQKDVNKRLLSRLDLVKHSMKDILEIGSGTGALSSAIQKKYSKAKIVSLDLSHEMSKIHKLKNPNAICITAIGENPPFKKETFDTILSSLTLHWCKVDLNLFLKYTYLLKPEGLLLFTAAGPDTFREFKKCPQEIYNKLRFNRFLDMHHYGDFMLSANLKDPVVDSELITLEFSSLELLLKSLRFTGTNITSNEHSQHITKSEYNIIEQSLYNEQSNSFELTYEIIFGYALKHPKTLDKSSKLIEIKEVKKD